MEQLPTLFKRTESGAIQQWRIVVEGGSYKTVEGQMNGKLTESVPTIACGKSIGRSNETTDEEQAWKEAKSKWQAQIDMNGYWNNINDIDKPSKIFEPMLAQKWEDRKDKITSFPVYSQPKLDGMRCIINKNGMWSRRGKKVISAPHIFEQLKPLFDFNPNYIFDGELYADKYKDDFNKIMSLAKKTKPTPEDLKDSAELLEYHIYDFPFWNDVFSKRHEALTAVLRNINLKTSKIREVETTLVKSQDHMDELFAKYLEDGYEGQMIRVNDSPYENKRTDQLLKRKTFLDEEFVITDIIEGKGNRSGMAGKVEVITDKGIKTKAGIKGGFDFYRELLKNKSSYIGKEATVKFQGFTEDGQLRFGTVISIRDYE